MNADPVGEEESGGASRSSGLGRKSNPPRRMTGRKHGRGNKVVAKLT